MIRISIVEDDPNDLQQLIDCLQRYEREQPVEFSINSYDHPQAFLNAYQCDSDMILMDIEMPLFNGIETARQLRAVDPHVPLVFITNMAQYAISGYEVEAADYVLKPINYRRFVALLGRILRLRERNREKEILIKSGSKMIRTPVSAIYYVEIRDHLLIYWTRDGRIDSWGKLSEAEAELADHGFVRCNSANLVNLQHVTAVENGEVTVGGTVLPLSRRRRKGFTEEITRYLSGK